MISTSKISEAAQKQQLLRISYIDSKNKATVRTVEPYEIKDGKLYAFCTNKQAIRAFLLSGVYAAEVTDQSFEPRFPIKIDGGSNG
jgi:predicted DNA-binding transcriptional regulator YafY